VNYIDEVKNFRGLKNQMLVLPKKVQEQETLLFLGRRKKLDLWSSWASTLFILIPPLLASVCSKTKRQKLKKA